MARTRRELHPTRLVVVAYLAAIGIGTVLLRLPFAHDKSQPRPNLAHCLFTATSAVTVTGLVNVSPSTWSPFGEAMVLTMVQIGGLGIMTIGALLALRVSRRLELRQRMTAQAELGVLTLGEVREVVRTIFVATFAIEGVVAALLTGRLWQSGDEAFGGALWSGVFHAVMAFNNAGMSLYDDNLTRFVDDPIVCLTISVAIVLGGIGFPVLLQLARRQRPRAWSLHTKLTLLVTAGLLVAGPLAVTSLEWTNPNTLRPLGVGEKLLAGTFQGISPRTAGFNTIDIGGMRPSTLLVVIVLMFIGAGAASTGGGIKVTTFAVVGLSVWSQLRGRSEPTAFRRRISPIAVQHALTVVALSIGSVAVATIALLTLSNVPALDAMFEAYSAFGTVGMSTGATAAFKAPAQIVLVMLMLAGRLGPTTAAAALVVRERPRRYRYPEERPIIG